MVQIKRVANYFTKLLLLFVFLAGGTVSAQQMVHPKVKKGGKLEAKKNKPNDHHNKIEKKKQHHKVEWNQHSQAENSTFSKKKKKKIKIQK